MPLPNKVKSFSVIAMSPIIAQSGVKTLNKTSNVFVYGLNILLVSLALVLALVYVWQANIIAADNYKIKTLTEKINSLEEQNVASASGLTNDPSMIAEFAQNHNMVQATDVVHIFERGAVSVR